MFLSERGPVMRCLAGHSADPDIRPQSSSGGVATSLMIHLLESGQVDPCFVIGMENERTVRQADIGDRGDKGFFGQQVWTFTDAHRPDTEAL